MRRFDTRNHPGRDAAGCIHAESSDRSRASVVLAQRGEDYEPAAGRHQQLGIVELMKQGWVASL